MNPRKKNILKQRELHARQARAKLSIPVPAVATPDPVVETVVTQDDSPLVEAVVESAPAPEAKQHPRKSTDRKKTRSRSHTKTKTKKD